MKQAIQLLLTAIISAALVIGVVHIFKLANKPDSEVIIGDYSTYGVSIENPVVIFTREGCVYCEMLVNYLSKNNIEFIDKNISSPQIKAAYEQLNKNVTPIVLIGDKLITGYQKRTINHELIKLGLLVE